MSTERDAGLQALQQGNAAAAAPLLETACQKDPADFDALLFLGAAYGQLGRQMDAINTITRAVQLQPANAQARYNLAVAMEQGGYRDQAVQALGQALTLQPDYPKAQEALRRMQGGSSATGSTAAAAPPEAAATQGASSSLGAATTTPNDHGFGAPLSSEQAAAMASPYSAPASEPPPNDSGLPQFGFGQVSGGSGTVQLGAMPPAGGQQVAAAPQWGAPPGSAGGPPAQEQPLYGAPPGPAGSPQSQTQPLYGAPPPSQGAYGQPPMGANTAGSSVRRPDLAGNVPPSPYGAPAQNPIGSPYGNPHGAPVNQGLYSESMANVGGPMRNTSYVDSFNLIEAVKSWGRIIAQPAGFFREMTGTTGFSAPFALAALYLIPTIVAAFLSFSKLSTAFSSQPQLGRMMAGGGVLVYLLIYVPVVIVGMFLCAWVIHLIGLLFNNRAPYSASFRALVFGWAPVPIISLLVSFIPMEVGNPNFGAIGFTYLMGFVSFVWSTILLTLAVSSEQEISGGPAFAVVILSYIAWVVIWFAIGIILLIGFGILAAALGAH